MRYYVYKITNTINNKVYIGVTNNLDRRWKEHVYKSEKVIASKLYAAIRKHDIQNFNMEVIYCTSSKEHVFESEVLMIIEQNSVEDGYNIDSGGYGGSDYRSEETRLKISLSAAGRTHTQESKAKMSISRSGAKNHMHGVKRPQEFRDNMSLRQKGIPTGRKLSDVNKKNLRDCVIARMATDEGKQKAAEMGRKNLGKKHKPRTEEHIKKLSDAHKDKPRPQVTCPHCRKVGGVGSMHQWHFNKCKLRPPLPIDNVDELSLTS